ncbi:class A beta-lactamase-related serine hydrolase [Galbibacter sp. EGI 63066]|uniref:serine hydrolase n=1 Tax=Galbibacter sp. EGI 63066 TaxID=2993559 RepID=UPI002248A8E4|nr:serine hydrolase [Galbibacter sp. EGI 63066]MCX2681333.1 class A beta-lactamase-related serine hydrolase [Galbibacter sp. EGI 63066]
MRFLIVLFTCSFLFTNAQEQNTKVADYYQIDEELNDQLQTIVSDLGIDGEYYCGEEDGWERISFAVIYEKDDQAYLSGVNYDNFIYPASMYKMYVAAEVLSQISDGDYDLNTTQIVRSPNDVDTKKEIPSDPRPLLRDKDTVTTQYLLDLMITRSDNSAANCLIDLADRKQINEMMHQHNWQGSEVTRKFLSQKLEDKDYLSVRGTETSALHAADFLYLINKDKLINPWVSRQMKTFLGRQLDDSKLVQGLPDSAMFYHKTGWWSHWTIDVGIVTDGKQEYIIALLMPIEEEKALPIFKEIGQRVHQLMVDY